MSNGAKESRGWGMFDPWGVFGEMRDVYLENMAKTMVDFVNTDAYAQATGAMLDGYLSVAAPVRDAMEKAMPQILAHYGMPSREEVLSVAARMTNIEMRLDDLDAKLDGIARALQCGDELDEKAA